MTARVQIIEAREELQALEGEWYALVERLPQSTPFQLPTWLVTWWTHFGSGTLQTLAVRNEDRLIGVVPLFRHSWNNQQQLTLLGTGLSDYVDPAIQPGYEEIVQQAVSNYLSDSAKQALWDVVDWQDLSSTHAFADLPGATWVDSEACSEVQLNGSFDDFWASRSKDLRRNVRRYRERAEAEGGAIAFVVSDEVTERSLNTLIALHALRWQKQGEEGTIAANSAETFLRAVLPKLGQLTLTRTFSLTFKNKIVAIILTFHYRGKIYSYLSAFDPHFEILGFGRLLLHEAFGHCYANGIVAWNFLRGEEPYKFSFGAKPIPKKRLQLMRTAFRDKG